MNQTFIIWAISEPLSATQIPYTLDRDKPYEGVGVGSEVIASK